MSCEGSARPGRCCDVRVSAVRSFMCIVFVLLFAGALPGEAAEETVWTYRRLDALYVEVPDSWSPYAERQASGVYTGKPPSRGASVGSLVVLAGREKKARYEDVLASLKRSPGGGLEAEFQQQEGTVGGRDAVLFTSIVRRREAGGNVLPFIGMRGVVWKDPAEDGILLLAAGGDAALFEAHARDIERIIASVRFEAPETKEVARAGSVVELPPIDLPHLAEGGAEKAETPVPEKEERGVRERPVFASDALLEEEIRKTRAALALRDEGALLLAQDDREGAMECFRRSLTYVPDDDLESFVEAEGRRKTEERKAEEERASALRRQGVKLQGKGLWKEALAAYRESLALNDEEDLRGVALGLEKLVRERASALFAQGEAFKAADRLEDALAAYGESLSWAEDDDVRRTAAALELRIREMREAASPERVFARALRDEGKTLEEQGRAYEALGKYRESLESHGADDLRLHADALERSLKERARALVREGAALQRNAQFAEALEKFRESLKHYPLKEVEAHMEKLEEFLKK